MLVERKNGAQTVGRREGVSTPSETHPDPMTDQAILIEMARLLSIIERHWATHFTTGNEIDALTAHRVHAILTEYRQRYPAASVNSAHP